MAGARKATGTKPDAPSQDKPKWDAEAKAKELGAARTVKTLQALNRLGKLGTTRYHFSAEQIDAIFNAVRARLDRVEKDFRSAFEAVQRGDTGTVAKEEETFTL